MVHPMTDETTAKPKKLLMALNSINTLVIPRPDGVSFLYQFDLDASNAKNDEITLEHNETPWKKTIAVSSLREISEDWVRLRFEGMPKTGTFNLVQDPKDDEEPYYVFWDVPYDELGDTQPKGEYIPLVLEGADLEEDDDDNGDSDS